MCSWFSCSIFNFYKLLLKNNHRHDEQFFTSKYVTIYLFRILSCKKSYYWHIPNKKSVKKKIKKKKQFCVKQNSQASIYNTARLFNA